VKEYRARIEAAFLVGSKSTLCEIRQNLSRDTVAPTSDWCNETPSRAHKIQGSIRARDKVSALEWKEMHTKNGLNGSNTTALTVSQVIPVERKSVGASCWV
jgi:hypothetical protein